MTEKFFLLELENKIIEVLKSIFDPEIPVNIYEMGLIYEAFVDDEYIAHIKMTVTAPNCPVAETLPIEVHNKIKQINGINDVDVVMSFDPPWNPDMMTDAAKLELGIL